MDALKYGIFHYHGIISSIGRIQKIVDPIAYKSNKPIPYAKVEAYLKKSKDSKHKKLLKYLNTVISHK